MDIPDKINPWYRDDDVSVLEIYDMDKQTREVLCEFDYLIEAPNWSRERSFLVYNSGGRLYKYEIGTGQSNLIDSGFADNCNNDHVLSPDGRFIALSHGSREDGLSRVYVLPIKGGTPRLVTPNAPSYLHGWSPDGETLSYCAQRDGEYDVYAVPARGGEEVRLTDSPGLNDGPEYDPSGEYIWYNSVHSGLMQVWRMRSDGSEQTQMTFDEDRNSWFPHVSPDGSSVVMISYKKGDLKPDEHLPHKDVELRLMSAEGGAASTVATLWGGQGTINVNSWSPDGRKFAFVSYKLKNS